MTNNKRNARRPGGGNRISNVRVVPQGEGDRAMRMERQVTAVKESQSFNRILVKSIVQITPGAAATLGYYSFGNLFAEDEFTSMFQQYNKVRVMAMRFDVYDVSPNNTGFGVFGTYHGPSAEVPTSLSEITDLPDASVVPPGTGKNSYYWQASGFDEKNFSAGANLPNNGGLAYYTANGTGGAKWQFIVSALVDFRARV